MPSASWTPERPFQALALTGGGYRGLFTARALQVIEEHIKEPIGRRFDLVCGTSIGGIVALAVGL
jgi:patatin-like phospholipase/acyl hydrolase